MAFRAFLAAHGKSYAPHKFAERLAVFRANADFITKHNSENAGFELGLNQFADLSFEEFSKTHLGLLPLGINGSYQCADRVVLGRSVMISPVSRLALRMSQAPGGCRTGSPSFRYADTTVSKSVDWVRLSAAPPQRCSLCNAFY